MVNPDEIRAFIAVELPDDLKLLLREFENRFKLSKFRCAKWVAPESIHLTLKFLGNVSSRLLDEVIRSVKIEVESSRPFILTVGESGCFPNIKRPKVFWLGLTGDTDKLVDLQSRIDGATAKLGFARESRSFTAHLTLARLREDCSILERNQFAEAVKGANLETDYSMRICSISLIRSHLKPGGAVYTRLHKFSMPE